MDGCVKALIEIGIDLCDVFCMTSYTPAQRIGMTDIGDIAEGFAADLVAMDENYDIIFTAIGGKKIC